MIPSADFTIYELATPLFTDYAEKQRLIKLPAGKRLKVVGNGLPDFPDETILVKTFYYYRDKRNAAIGKKIIETRLLIKHDGKWNVATYKWNTDQSEAKLLTTGENENISWIDEYGTNKNITYHVPENIACNTCHQSHNSNMPIGFKIRNINREVARDGKTINQLFFLQGRNIFDNINPLAFEKLPDWQNTNHTLAERARAYLDVNCAHCHSNEGACKKIVLRTSYETPFSQAYLENYRKAIIIDMEKHVMPKLGTSIPHAEAIALLKEYFSTF